MRPSVALTTDIGEGFGRWTIADDDRLLEIVTAANVACGFHAGDPDIMRRTCEAAVHQGVAIGAQVSYRDLVGFGRRYLAVPVETLTNDLLYQIGALDAFARVAGTRVSYVRAHGALYNVAARDRDHALAVVRAVQLYDPSLPLLCQVGTATWEIAQEHEVRTMAEAFVDRAYTDEGLLVPRDHPDSMLVDPQVAAERAVSMVLERRITSIDGAVVPIEASALLIHSDTAGAVEIARATRTALESAGVALTPVA
jgi:UPF0271 protein